MNCTNINFINSCLDLQNINSILSYASNFLHIELGTIVLLLSLPIIMTIASFSRHILGIKTLGSYVPTIIIFSFLTTGLLQGAYFFFIIIFVSIFTKILMNKFKLLFLPRITIVMTIVTIAVLLGLLIAGLLNIHSLINISLFPILMMIIAAEKFILVQIKEGTSRAFSVALETLILASLAYLALTSKIFIQFLVSYPYILLLLIPINFATGKFTGLRLSEYFRFKSLFKK